MVSFAPFWREVESFTQALVHQKACNFILSYFPFKSHLPSLWDIYMDCLEIPFFSGSVLDSVEVAYVKQRGIRCEE